MTIRALPGDVQLDLLPWGTQEDDDFDYGEHDDCEPGYCELGGDFDPDYVDYAWEAEYRTHSSSITGIFEGI